MSNELKVVFKQGTNTTVKTFKSDEELDTYITDTYGVCKRFNLETREGREEFREWCQEEDNI